MKQRHGIGDWHRQALIIALAIEAVLFVAVQGDMPAADPLWYASIAHRISLGWSQAFAATSTHPFEMRVGLTVPLAGLYHVLGVSMIVTDLPCLAAALVILLVIYAASPTPRAKLLGLVLGVCSVTLVQEAGLLNIDLPGAALSACSILFLSWRDRPRGAAWRVAAMLAWFAAFLVKETALWTLPVWVYAIVVDVRAVGWQRAARGYAPAIAAGIALAAGYLVLCAHVWGNPLARFASVEDLTGDHEWSMAHSSASAWIERMTWGPPVLLAELFGAAVLPALVAPWLVRGQPRLWWVAMLAHGGLFWFGSSSLRAYEPLPLIDRMAMPVLVPVLILAAVSADVLIARLDRFRRMRRWLVAGWLVAVVVPNALMISSRIRRERAETAVFALLRREAADPTHQLVVVAADPRGVPVARFYFGFEPPANVQLVYAPDFADAALPARATVRVLISLSRARAATKFDPRGDRVNAIEALHLPVLQRYRNIQLYDASDGAQLHDALQAAEHR